MDLQEALCNEIKINRVYETKIKRLERQALRYEEDIRWLYKVIENLENNAKHNKDELCDLKSQLTNLSLRLQHANKICDEKEQFIAFRESQLLEFEDTIHSLKERIHFLSREKRKLKMSALHTDPPDVIMTGKDELGELGTIELVEEVRSLSRQMSNAIINSHEEERSKNLAREKQARIGTATTIIYNRLNDLIVDLQNRLDQKDRNYNALRDEALDIITADRHNIRRLERQVAILKIQNRWRQIRLMNPIVNPVPYQPIDQICLLFH